MRALKIAVALVASMALTALSATVAQAAWTIEGTPFPAGGETVTVSGGPFTLKSKLLGAEIVLEAEKVECDEEGGGVCKIDEVGVTDHSVGRLTFTGVTVHKPEGGVCFVHSPGRPVGTITTEALTDQIIMDPAGGEATFDKFFPEVPETFVTIELEGKNCPLAGVKAEIKGTVTGRTLNTGVLASPQTITFSAAEQATGGGVLKLGKEAATLEGTASNVLSGANAGKKFGAD